METQTTNYLHVDWDSHFFDNLEQIKNYAAEKDDYLKKGIENTIKNGYAIFKVEPKTEVKLDKQKLLIEEKVLFNVLNRISKKESPLNSAPDEEYMKSLVNLGMIEMEWDIELTKFGWSMLDMLKNKIEK